MAGYTQHIKAVRTSLSELVRYRFAFLNLEKHLTLRTFEINPIIF